MTNENNADPRKDTTTGQVAAGDDKKARIYPESKLVHEKFLKPFNAQETEARIYKLWEDSGYFNPDNLPARHQTPYTIVLPPPNVTGILHMGHAVAITLEDIMIRYHRMQGFKTLWLPGTDHAAIATQSKVEKDISKKEGKTRYDLGREEMLKRIGEFVQGSHDTIIKQAKTFGASCDWSREAFTLDDKRNFAVRTAFKAMYDDGLIYRGHRIVNWDPKGQTTISDDEIVYVEEKTKFYYFKYGPFVIGTSRPETKFGDKCVVMHPDDKRYSAYKHGQEIELEWINGPIKAVVIKDEAIDMAFGTGVMTITPWHSMEDFEIARRHNLDKEQIIDKYGKLMPVAGEFAGMKITEARQKIVDKLQAKGLVEKVEDYVHNVATAERTGGMIEPQIMNQWFVAVNKPFIIKHSQINGIPAGSTITLKDLMSKVVLNNQIEIIPDYFGKTYFHWIEKLNDWCISRQIWYGHRVPVWYRNINGQEEVYNGLEAPIGEGWTQDEDTLDTWFSSALWTFSTLGWPEAFDSTTGLPKPGTDLALFHPTQVLETGYDILFFWVARMILMSGYHLGTIPFSKIYLHGTVRDNQGRKFSKTLNNGVDPMEVSAKFGTDAGRMGIVIGNTPGIDFKFSEDKIRAQAKFANKIWNASRFVLSNLDDFDFSSTPELTEEDQKSMDELNTFIVDITKDMDEYRFYMASDKIYNYFWHDFADIIIERSKTTIFGQDDKAKKSVQYMTWTILTTLLKVIHPFMPFVTEEIWSLLPLTNRKLLMIEEWPKQK
ncbi:MAG: valine--tRNA ligase [bacterium]